MVEDFVLEFAKKDYKDYDSCIDNIEKTVKWYNIHLNKHLIYKLEQQF